MRGPAPSSGVAMALAVAAAAWGLPARADEATPSAASAVPLTAAAATTVAEPTCVAGQCSYRMSADQILAIVQRMIADKQYDEARPLVAALKGVPGMTVPYHFFDGMIALETGDPATAASHFRAILNDQPGQTRVRLELAKALMAQGDRDAADYHLRLALNDKALPEDIVRQITDARSIIRTKRNWRFGFDFGLAPDSNINSATNAETVDVNFGPLRVPLELDPQARARSGTGITANAFGSLRLRTSEDTAIVTDLDASMVNYDGKTADNYSVQLAVGPERELSRRTTLSIQGVGLYRWYGGALAARQFGAKVSLQHDLGTTQRLGFQLDGRHSDSDFGPGYTGWQMGGVATYEHVVGKSAIASGSVFVRRDFMNLSSYSDTSVGFNLGIGGELPLGLNAGVFGGASTARYDAPQLFFSSERREDWRYQGRAYLGLRKIRALGFSPSIEYNYARVDTNYDIYQSTRHRVEFKLARYF